MQLPGRLRDTTLGDLLGTLHRGAATGVLELVEGGAIHRVHLARGSVTACESPRGLRLSEWLLRDGLDPAILRQSLQQAVAAGELHGRVLVARWQVDAAVVDRALRAQILARLAVLEGLTDAQIRFRVAVRAPRGGTPVEAQAVLQGRRRYRARPFASASTFSHGGVARDGGPETQGTRGRDESRSSCVSPLEADPKIRLRAAAHLGVSEAADRTTITRAFRALVSERHPDRATNAEDAAARNHELREILAAYRALVA